MEARPTYGSMRKRSSTIDNGCETDLRTNQNTVMHNRTMDARPTYGPIRTLSCRIEHWRRDRPKDQSEYGHRQVNYGGETDIRINEKTVIDNWKMDARPTYGPIRTRSCTIEQWMRDRPTEISEHGHRQENNWGETDLWINQNAAIDNRTMEARPNYGPIRTRSLTIEQRMRYRPTDQSEHGQAQ